MSKFILPDKWYLLWDCEDTFEQSIKYTGTRYLYFKNSGIRSDKTYISFENDRGKKNGYKKITCEQFVEYVLNEPIKKQKSVKEDTSYLINFLKQNNIT